MEKIKNYINGKLVEPSSGQYIDNFEPAQAKKYAETPRSNEKDLEVAVSAAKAAFPSWSKLTAEKRASYLRKISNLITDKLDEIAKAETIDTGKPIQLSSSIDIPRSATNFSFFADAITQFASESHTTSSGVLNYTLRQPLGVVGCISPWNLPLYLLTWKIAPALAAGNCVIAKPSEVTPMTAFLLSKICMEADLPPGVLNIVHGLGSEIGDALCKHKDVKAVSFTGSTVTGSAIAKVAAPTFRKLSLELGGKNPNIIFADCDLEKAVSTTLRSSFSNQGQICLCGSRILIEESIYEKFKTEFVKRTKNLKMGDPLDKSTDIGSLVSEPHFKKVMSYIQLAKEEGGKVLTGGNSTKGWFIEPTIIEGLKNDCKTNQEEIFGPVVTLIPFKSDKQAIELANQSRYGLASSIWTSNLKRAHQVAAEIQSGIVWINTWMQRDLRTPFGGVKDSGVGREGGWEALRFFTEPKNVCVNYE
jgi:aminomuconate-semialdehyde/2-hydroxymuconate-6-semialdehyde dehydrogenase